MRVDAIGRLEVLVLESELDVLEATTLLADHAVGHGVSCAVLCGAVWVAVLRGV
jgi:hypothetical protein